ncbi:MAG TPA: hypothetical protein VGQ60_02515 [Nitrospiraceae bacterium]|jgi:hypothetical protein|nr:hypothetical protein [Nitrospiraceae bacterium]
MRYILIRFGLFLFLAGLSLGSSALTWAADNDILLRGDFGREDFRQLTRQLGFAASYFPLAPAAPLGILGFDIGVEATAVNISEKSSFWQKAVRDGNAPSYLVIPRLHAQKGLPFNIDVGASYTMIPGTNISLVGGEVKWAAIPGNAVLPAIAVRLSGTKLFGGSEVGLETYGVDLSISKGIAFLTPYAGIGQLWINSRTDSAAVRSVNGVDFRESENMTKAFVGLKIKPPLVPFSIVGQADFAVVSAYSLRLNVSF